MIIIFFIHVYLILISGNGGGKVLLSTKLLKTL